MPCVVPPCEFVGLGKGFLDGDVFGHQGWACGVT